MIIDFGRVAAYLCPACGSIAFAEFSLFELSGGRGIQLACDCGKSKLNISPRTQTEYVVAPVCMMCDEVHEYITPLDQLMKNPVLNFACPELFIGLVSIGKQEEVLASVQKTQDYVHEILTACGLAHTGKNGLTFLKALNKIQELSEDGALFCGCGSNLIDVDVLEDEIVLECHECKSTASFTAKDVRTGNFSEVTEMVIPKRQKSTNEE